VTVCNSFVRKYDFDVVNDGYNEMMNSI